MLKKADQVLTFVAFTAIVLFSVYTLSEMAHHVINHGKYAVQSAPWYTGILVRGAFAGAVIVIKIIVTVLRYGANGEGRATRSMFYSAKKDAQIMVHEERILDEYTRALKVYEPEIIKYGYSMNVSFCWRNPMSGDMSLMQRPAFQEGYACGVRCMVQKDGENAYVNYTFDGEEIGKCELSCKWRISEIFWWFAGPRISLQTKVSDNVIYDMRGMLYDMQIGSHVVGDTCAPIEPQKMGKSAQ